MVVTSESEGVPGVGDRGADGRLSCRQLSRRVRVRGRRSSRDRHRRRTTGRALDGTGVAALLEDEPARLGDEQARTGPQRQAFDRENRARLRAAPSRASWITGDERDADPQTEHETEFFCGDFSDLGGRVPSEIGQTGLRFQRSLATTPSGVVQSCRGWPRNVVKGGGAGWSRTASGRREADVQTTSSLRGSLYGIAQRYDKSLGLRVLDVCAIGGAWLLAGVAAFDDRADAAALRNLIWFVGVPLIISMIVNQVAGLVRPGLALRIGGRSGARRRRCRHRYDASSLAIMVLVAHDRSSASRCWSRHRSQRCSR